MSLLCVFKERKFVHHARREKPRRRKSQLIDRLYGALQRGPGQGKNPTIVLIDRKTKMKHANVRNNKDGQDHYAIERVALVTVNMCYGHFVFKSDQEPAILLFKDAVTRRVTAMQGGGENCS